MSYLMPENEAEQLDYKKDYFYTSFGTFGVSGFNADGHEVGNFCYICKTAFTGAQNCKFHFEGRKHAAKLKQFNDSKVQLIIDPIASSKGADEQPADSTNSMILEKYCKICEAELNTFEQREAHYNSEKHQRRVRHYVYIQMGIRDTSEPPSKADRAVEDPSTLSEMEYCHLCKIELSAPVVANAHYNGKKHAKKVRERMEKDKRNSGASWVRCDICEVELNSEGQYNQHIKSARHLKKEKTNTDMLDKKIRELERQKAIMLAQKRKASESESGEGSANKKAATEEDAEANTETGQNADVETNDNEILEDDKPSEENRTAALASEVAESALE